MMERSVAGNPRFRQMTVIGVGLIGSSLALRSRMEGCVERVVGVGRGQENLEVALDRGIIDCYTHSAEEGAEGADLVVLAVPVGSLVEMAERIGPSLKEGAIVTDVGSVKGSLVEEMEAKTPESRFFVGGHPIAGTHSIGAQAGDPHLFDGKRCILTPTPRTSREALRRVSFLWRRVGAVVEEMDPRLHDVVLAAVSHLPQVVASCLVNAVAPLTFDGKPYLDYAGSGFRDTTRIAASDPVMWRDIWRYNAGSLSEMLRLFMTAFQRVSALLEAEDWVGVERYLCERQAERNRLAPQGDGQ